MINRTPLTIRALSIGTAGMAIAAASPAFAGQPEMTYEQRPYEYAQPAPTQAAPIIYQQHAVVQPVPVRAPEPARYQTRYEDESVEYETEYETEYRNAGADYAPPHHGQAYPAHPHQAPVTPYPMHHQQVVYPQHGPYPATQPMPQPPAFDREAWLEECEYRVTGGERRRDGNGNIIGGILGAATGGLIGNRVAGRGDRLAGSLIGAGVGGLAGLAIGAAIDAASDDDRDDGRAYCEDYLARYSHSQQNYGYGYGQTYYAQPMMLVPVMVQVPQRAVVREYVTEEVVHVEKVTYEEVPRQRVIKRVPVQSKPVPIKRVRSVKSIKGN